MFSWLGLPVSALDVAGALRLAVALRQLRTVYYDEYVTKGASTNHKNKSGGRASGRSQRVAADEALPLRSRVRDFVATLVIVHGGEAIVAPWLGLQPAFFLSSTSSLTFLGARALVDLFPMMTTTSETYILVTIPNATPTSSTSETLTGQLALEYVTFDIPPTAAAVTQDVLLVLVLRTNNNNVVPFEAPLDPARALTVSSVRPSRGAPRRRYLFHATRDDAEFTVELPDQSADENVELFHSVLVGYVADLRVQGGPLQSAAAPPTRVVEEDAAAEPEGDLRGRFVLMNEGDGQIVGTLDSSVRVNEDLSLAERGHEGALVVVKLPKGTDNDDPTYNTNNPTLHPYCTSNKLPNGFPAACSRVNNPKAIAIGISCSFLRC